MKELIDITRDFVQALEPLRFTEPVTHVYNPLVYAREPHELYLGRARKGCEAILVGMNPGPFGMAQTGVPFGEVSLVRDWLKINGKVEHPPVEHPKRPILGFDCTRSEVSGRRLWGWARETFRTPARFFKRFFILNYCPFVFMEASGRNLTPDKLPKATREELFATCDVNLRRAVECLAPRLVIGVGNFAETRARVALEGLPVTIGRILHPSPQSPAANRGWAAAAERELRALGVRVG